MKRVIYLSTIIATALSIQIAYSNGEAKAAPAEVKPIEKVTTTNPGQTLEASGSKEFKNANFADLTVHGAVAFDHLEVGNKLLVDGALNGDYLKCSELNVNGAINADHIIVKNGEISGSFAGDDIKIEGNLTVSGSISSKNIMVGGKFIVDGLVDIENGDLSDVAMKAASMDFSASKIKSILVHSIKGPDEQILTLSKNTVVTGDIEFESGKGQIIMTKGSSVKGHVKGAQIVNK